MSANELCRKWTLSSSVILTVVGMGLSIGAIMTPSWQLVNLMEYNAVHEHGLWIDCIRHTRDGNVLLRRYTTITEPLHCVFKWDYDRYSGTFVLEDDNSPVGEVNRHKFYGWHVATLVLLGLALLTAFTSACIGTCGCCYASLSLVFTALTLLTTFLSSIAIGVFFFFSHRADNRFVKGIVGTYEQRIGLAFFLEMAACFFHFVSFLIAMLATYFAFTGKGGALDRYSLPHSSKTNMTNMARSQEFEHPVFIQHSAGKGPLRPYYQAQKADEFDRAVADSMPELAHRSYAPSDVLPPRIRRKSETCV